MKAKSRMRKTEPRGSGSGEWREGDYDDNVGWNWSMGESYIRIIVGKRLEGKVGTGLKRYLPHLHVHEGRAGQARRGCERLCTLFVCLFVSLFEAFGFYSK